MVRLDAGLWFAGKSLLIACAWGVVGAIAGLALGLLASTLDRSPPPKEGWAQIALVLGVLGAVVAPVISLWVSFGRALSRRAQMNKPQQ